jgi:oligopeptide transport system permease protein
MLITLFITITLGFMVIRLMPGGLFDDAVDMSAEQKAALEAKYHLDKPIPVQYGIFLKDLLLKGDWGTSLKLQINVPVWNIIRDKIPVSLYINFFALLISLPLGIVLGIAAAVRKNSSVDYMVSFLVVVCISVPSFIFASLLQYYIAFKAGLFPIVYNPTVSGLLRFRGLFLPILALTFSPIARVTRYLRAELAETINSDFMLLAKTKGLTELQATVNHGIRNSLLPLMNVIVPMFTTIMGGSMVIENIFAIPGMGGVMVKSVNASDYSVTLAALIFYSVVSLMTVLIVDISYGIVDPRIRMGAKHDA